MTVQSVGQWIGGTTDWNTASNWGCGIIPTSTTDVFIPTVPEGGNFPIVTTVNSATCQDLEILLGASVTISGSSDLSVYGNFYNEGDPTLGAGTIRFRSSAAQIISGPVPTQYTNVILDNSSTTVSLELQQNMEVSGTFTFVAGKVNLNGQNIDLGTTGELVAEDNSRKIFGTAGEITATRTLVANTTYTNIAGIGLGIETGAVAPGLTDFARGHFSHQQLGVYNSIQRYFDISPTVNTGLDATMTFYYFEDELEDIDGIDPIEDNLIPWRSTDAGLTWEGQHFPTRLSNDNVNNWVALTQIDGFSRWTLSDWLTEPLPVTLLSFTAEKDADRVALNWVTASEINSASFEVERSIDLETIITVLSTPAAGYSTTIRNYNGWDETPVNGLSYYRLKQLDFNGDVDYSDWVPVMFERDQIQVFNAWVSGEHELTLQIGSYQSGPMTFTLFDLTGRLILTGEMPLSKGLNSIRIPHDDISDGMYLLRVTKGGAIWQEKFFMR
jgi:hypothetical protein